MSRKEWFDVVFRVSLVLVLVAGLFVYYETSQVNRYHLKKFEDPGYHYVFDSRSGKLYWLFPSNNKSLSFVWAVFPLFDSPQGKPVAIKPAEPLHPVKKPDLSKLSDEELARIAGVKLEKPPAKAKPQPLKK